MRCMSKGSIANRKPTPLLFKIIMYKDFCLFTIPKNRKKIVWEIISQCNMNCKHCCANSSQSVYADNFIFINQEMIRKRINEMISSGIKEFYVSGGEPFLVKNIFDFLRYLKKQKTKVSVATNGYFINEKMCKELSEIEIDLLHISLDGHLAKIHNFLRGGNFFDRVVRNIKMLVKNNIPLRIGCIIWRKNENYLEEMVKFCIQLGVENLRFSWLIKIGRFIQNQQIYPKRKYFSILREIENLKEKYKNEIKLSIHRELKMKNKGILGTCPGGKNLFFLNPKGQLSPCSWIAKSDNKFTTNLTLKEMNFQRLANSNEILSYRKMVHQRSKQKFYGCPFIARYQNNSYYSNDNLNL